MLSAELHEIDRSATRIWFAFFPLSLHLALADAPDPEALARKMATAWANFARKGDPSQPGLKWDPFDPKSGRTMIFDNNCRMMDDPEGEVRKILLS